MKTLRLHKVGLAAALLLAGSPAAFGQTAGYDLLQTQAGAQIDLSKSPGFSDFKPTSFHLKGVPICACIGSTDTIMRRTGMQTCKPPNLEVVALFLKNSDAVTFKGKPVDVYLTVNHSNGVIGQNVLPQPEPFPLSTGCVTVKGGTFATEIHVVPYVIAVPVGADVTDPANQLFHQKGPDVYLKSPASPWSSTKPAGYPTACFFPANGFYPSGPVHENASSSSHAHPVNPTQGGDTKDLKIAKVTLPANACLFDPHCAVTGPHYRPAIHLPGISGKAVLQSATFLGLPGSPGAGLTAYEYRLFLDQAVGTTCVASLSLDFGTVSSLHYSGGTGLEQVWVTTGRGSVAPATAVQSGDTVTITFQRSLCAGDTSFYFGLTSAKPPKAATAIVTVAGGPPVSVDARAPQL